MDNIHRSERAFEGLEFDTPFLSGFHVNIFRQRVIDCHHIFQQILADTYKGFLASVVTGKFHFGNTDKIRKAELTFRIFIVFLDGPHDTLLKIHVFNSTIRILRILDRDLTLDTQQIGHFAFATEFPKVIFHHIFLIPGHLFLYILKIFGKLGVGADIVSGFIKNIETARKQREAVAKPKAVEAVATEQAEEAA